MFSGEHDGLKSESEALNESKTVETRPRRCGDSLCWIKVTERERG